MAAASSVITYLAQRGGKAITTLDVLPLGQRLGNALLSYARYILMMVWPKGLAVFYPHPGPSLPAWQVIVSVLLLAGITVLVVLAMRRFPYLFVGWFWYIGTLIPVIGIIQAGAQAMADRYTYIPLIGLFLIVAWGRAALATQAGGATPPAARWRIPKAVLAAAAGVVLVALTATAFAQTRHWRDSVALFKHTLAVTNGNHLAYKNLGVALASLERYDEAEVAYRKALGITPRDADLHYDYGNLLNESKRTEEAAAELRKAIEIDPNHHPSHYNLANMLAAQGKYEEAVSHYQQVIKQKPDHLGAYINLGNTFAMLGRPADAIVQFLDAIKLDPASVDTYVNLGNASAEQQKYDDAVKYYLKAIQLDPKLANARCNLGFTLKKQGKLREAADAFAETLRLDPGNAIATESLAQIQAELNRGS